jgi:GLPGLI family protein
MKRIILFLVILGVFIMNTFGQTITVEYEFISDTKANPALATKQIYNLVVNDKNSISEKIETNTIHKFEDTKIEEKEDVIRKKISDEYSVIINKSKLLIYKDYVLDSLIYTSFIMTKRVVVSEKLDKFKWELMPNDTLYLDLKCKIAKTLHRGHTWTVFFSDNFGLSGGPWKLDGLPGLILYAQTEDKAYTFSAVKIESKKERFDIRNPFINDKTMSWDEYTKMYREKAMNYVKKVNSMNENGEKNTVFKIDNTMEDLGFKEIRQ